MATNRRKPKAKPARPDANNAPREKAEGPLKAWGDAVSAPMRETAHEDEREQLEDAAARAAGKRASTNR